MAIPDEHPSANPIIPAWLKAQIGRVSAADRRFFKRFPHRKHRLRPTSKAELKYRSILGGPRPLPDGMRWFTIARHLGGDQIAWLYIYNSAEADIETSEEIASAIYKRLGALNPRMFLEDGVEIR